MGPMLNVSRDSHSASQKSTQLMAGREPRSASKMQPSAYSHTSLFSPQHPRSPQQELSGAEERPGRCPLAYGAKLGAQPTAFACALTPTPHHPRRT